MTFNLFIRLISKGLVCSLFGTIIYREIGVLWAQNGIPEAVCHSVGFLMGVWVGWEMATGKVYGSARFPSLS